MEDAFVSGKQCKLHNEMLRTAAIDRNISSVFHTEGL